MKLLPLVFLVSIISCAHSKPFAYPPRKNERMNVAEAPKDCYLVAESNDKKYGTFKLSPNNTPLNFECIIYKGKDFIKTRKTYSYTDNYSDNGSNLKWVSPPGETSDGASIPSVVWFIFGHPFDSKNLRPAIIHDYYYCARTRTRSTADDTLYSSLLAEGKGWLTANLMFLGVRIGAPDKWEVLNCKPPKPCNTKSNFYEPEARSCEAASGKNYEYLHASNLFNNMQDYNGRDLAKKTFVAKYGGMIRTMKTTNGEILDVVNGLLVPYGSPAANDHIEKLQMQFSKVVKNRGDHRYENFGLMTIIDSKELERGENISPWARGQIKVLDDYIDKNDLNVPELYSKKRSKDDPGPALFVQRSEKTQGGEKYPLANGSIEKISEQFLGLPDAPEKQ